jgi:hypothetical protein
VLLKSLLGSRQLNRFLIKKLRRRTLSKNGAGELPSNVLRRYMKQIIGFALMTADVLAALYIQGWHMEIWKFPLANILSMVYLVLFYSGFWLIIQDEFTKGAE